jgi:hypothetical protein
MLAALALPIVQGLFFFRDVSTLTGSQQIPIYLMCIEIRPIDAGKLGLSADYHAATPAHAGTIHHNRV